MENNKINIEIQKKLYRLACDFSAVETEEAIDILEKVIKELKKQKKGVKENDRPNS